MTQIKSLALTDMRLSLWLVSILTATLILSGCGSIRSDKVAFAGVYFLSSAKAVGKQRDFFQVAVSPASKSIGGAREAGRYEATRYCIKNFGTSNVEWVQGPNTMDGTYAIENNKLILRGTCKP